MDRDRPRSRVELHVRRDAVHVLVLVRRVEFGGVLRLARRQDLGVQDDLVQRKVLERDGRGLDPADDVVAAAVVPSLAGLGVLRIGTGAGHARPAAHHHGYGRDGEGLRPVTEPRLRRRVAFGRAIRLDARLDLHLALVGQPLVPRVGGRYGRGHEPVKLESQHRRVVQTNRVVLAHDLPGRVTHEMVVRFPKMAGQVEPVPDQQCSTRPSGGVSCGLRAHLGGVLVYS